MNLKSKVLLIVCVTLLGMSASSAADYEQNYDTEASKLRARVVKACKNPGVPDYLLDDFIPRFSAFLGAHKKTWSQVQDIELSHYINMFVSTGRLK